MCIRDRYAVEAWNKDLTLKDAFSSSCVWYFRKLIDQAGEDAVGQMLGRLHYGNCDISQWEGSGLNPMPQLNGFWLESSLMISPKEQMEVLANIFEGKTGVSEHSLEVLKEVMYRESVGDQDIYGKTGSGSQNAWFVGFTEENGKRVYFAVRITGDGENVHGNKAMEIALSILN